MSSLSNVEANLPPGFRFHPRDEELICDYLMKWVSGVRHQSPMLIEVELNKCEPWEIPETACVGDKEWYFYCFRDKKYSTGVRTNRATVSGYWKATGKDRPVARKGIHVGMRKTLVFYQGRAPKGRKTDWVMHEFRLQGPLSPNMKAHESSSLKEDWVLCRVFSKKSAISVNPLSITTDELPPSIQQPPAADHDAAIIYASGQYHEQVPCFSIITPTQANSGFSNHLLEDASTWNKSKIKDVLNRFAKRETLVDQDGIYESREVSSDSYLSSLWN